MTNKKKIQVTISEETYERLLDLSKKYGISYNSVAAFALGQWAEEQQLTMNTLSSTVDAILSSPEDVLSNPNLLNMVQEILKSDDDFKNAVKNKF